MGEAGLAFCAAHRGATARVLQIITLRSGATHRETATGNRK
jgi:hypothetical protein